MSLDLEDTSYRWTWQKLL